MMQKKAQFNQNFVQTGTTPKISTTETQQFHAEK
jgi:hypothetical protein